MKKHIKISIVIPVYKTEQYLQKCVESVLSQTYKNLEIILVEDGSPDNCPQLCDQFAAKDHRIQVIHKKNEGLMSAWIDGSCQSTGDYIAFVDSDDWIDPDMIEKMAEQLVCDKREIICGNYLLERGKKRIPHYNAATPGEYRDEKLSEIKKKIMGNEHYTIIMSRCMKLFSRELIIHNISLCNKEVVMGEDINITLPALLMAERIVIMKEALFYHYFFNENSIVHRYDQGMYQNNKMLYEIVRDILKKHAIENYEEQSARQYILLLTVVMRNELRGNRRYISSIKKICDENRNMIDQTKMQMSSTANKLIFYVMRHSSFMNIFVLKCLIGLYDMCS